MIEAILYKEWIKTRRVIFLILPLLLAFWIYAFIDTGQQFRVEGAVNVWAGIVMKDILIAPTIITWLPLLCGVLIGLAQFVPEVTNRRLKLTFHLPMYENKILLTMLLYGISLLGIIYLLACMVLIGGWSFWYPQNIILSAVMRVTPWFLGGFAGYIFTAWISIEPRWLQRTYNALVALCLLSLYFINAKSGAYLPMFVWLILIILIGFSFPFYAAYRFKMGVQ